MRRSLGAVKEQLRIGLSAVVDLSNRGLVFGDMQAHNDLQRLRRKHDMPPSSSYGGTDYATIKEEPAGAEAA